MYDYFNSRVICIFYESFMKHPTYVNGQERQLQYFFLLRDKFSMYAAREGAILTMVSTMVFHYQ